MLYWTAIRFTCKNSIAVEGSGICPLTWVMTQRNHRVGLHNTCKRGNYVHEIPSQRPALHTNTAKTWWKNDKHARHTTKNNKNTNILFIGWMGIRELFGQKEAATKAKQSEDHTGVACLFDSFHGWRRQWTCFLAEIVLNLDWTSPMLAQDWQTPKFRYSGKTFQDRDSIYYVVTNPCKLINNILKSRLDKVTNVFVCFSWIGNLQISKWSPNQKQPRKINFHLVTAPPSNIFHCTICVYIRRHIFLYFYANIC